MKYILAIDQSTSGTKALLFDAAGSVVDKESRDHEQIYPRPGWVEHDAEQIWQNTLAVVKSLMERNASRAENLLCLSITNQRETFVLFDRETGRPIHNAIVWQCRRGDSVCNELNENGHDNLIQKRTGLRIDSYFSAPKLTWLLRSAPDIREKVKSGQVLFGTIDTYLMYRLTDGDVYSTDHTNACRTLLYDINRLCWDEELLSLFEVPSASLPDVRESASVFGESTLEGVLDAPLPICGVMGDSQAALFAHRGFDPGTMKVTFGTGSSVLLNTGDTPSIGGSGTVATIAWLLNGRATYCLEGLINYSAATISWLKNQLGLTDDVRETEAMAKAVEDNGGVYLIPAFSGMGAPWWSPDARAAILGLTAHSDRNHIVRAGLESIAYQIRDAAEMMRAETGVAPQCILADGGATTNRFLMQFTADILGLEMRVSNIVDCSPLGAALSGALGMGFYQSLDELTRLPRESTSYAPAMDAEMANQCYGEWKEMVRRII